jgi:hypothetical protein
MQNRVFFPQTALDQWIVDEAIELKGTELVVLAEGRRYQLSEAVRIVAEVSGSPDSHDLVGRVKPRPFLTGLRAEILETSMIVGDNAYEVVQGWIGTPMGTFADHLASPVRAKARAASKQPAKGDPKSEEELLARLAGESP